VLHHRLHRGTGDVSQAARVHENEFAEDGHCFSSEDVTVFAASAGAGRVLTGDDLW
jgi:hypothetical protein